MLYRLAQGFHGSSCQLTPSAHLWVHIAGIEYEQADIAELIYELTLFSFIVIDAG